jgi:hypothetical protein
MPDREEESDAGVRCSRLERGSRLDRGLAGQGAWVDGSYFFKY